MSDTERNRMIAVIREVADDAHLITDALIAAGFGDVTKLRAKLDLPCGSCHPCTQWANQTWVNAKRNLPHVYQWDELRVERDALAAQVAAATALLRNYGPLVPTAEVRRALVSTHAAPSA